LEISSMSDLELLGDIEATLPNLPDRG
jgi:hypothetical protein